MGSAAAQGPLWGARARDWAELAEPAQTPFYDAVFDEIRVGPGTRLLDVGCGAGLALTLAAKRGAVVAGLDAAEGLLAVARERLPEDDIRVGDLEELPYADATFTAATSFNAVQYATDPVLALRELARVLVPGSPVAILTWVIRRARRCGRCWARSAGCCLRHRPGRAGRSRSVPPGLGGAGGACRSAGRGGRGGADAVPMGRDRRPAAPQHPPRRRRHRHRPVDRRHDRVQSWDRARAAQDRGVRPHDHRAPVPDPPPAGHLNRHDHPHVFTSHRGEPHRRSNFGRRALLPATNGTQHLVAPAYCSHRPNLG